MLESNARKISGSQSIAPKQDEYNQHKITPIKPKRQGLLPGILARHVTLGLRLGRITAMFGAKLKINAGTARSETKKDSAPRRFSAASQGAAGIPDIRRRTAETLSFGLRKNAAALSELLINSKPKRATLAMQMGILVLLMIASTFFGFGLEVTLNGKSIGYVDSQDEFLRAVGKVEQKAAEILGRPVALVPNVSYTFDYVDRRMFINTEAVEDQLFDQIAEIEKLYVLTVDGKVIGAMEQKEPFEGFLNELKGQYGGDSAEFVEDVGLSYQLTAKANTKTVDEIREMTSSNVQDRISYAPSAEDTPESIATRLGVTLQELIKTNPAIGSGVMPASVTIKRERSLISVRTSSKVVFSEVMPFETEYVNDSSMYKGKTKVVSEGKTGEVQCTDYVTCVNGVETSRTSVGRVVLMDPVVQVVAQGTKTPPPKSPTGKYIRPYRGVLTSNYGPRGGGQHTGVDFAGPVGSTIVASDGGVVTFAGWKGNYGNFVIIDHGDGISTCYAHNSKLLVTEGQKVGKGEEIALLGSTGRSTGPHCHFEVRVNGKTVSPWDYIS